MFVGHSLATYALEPHWESDSAVPRWKRIIVEAVESTRIAFPTEKIACMVDKRQFLEKQRLLIGATLDELGVAWTFKSADIKKMADDALLA